MEDRKLHIEAGDCGQCYRCVRVCPVKAIEIRGTQASVREELCVDCGKCLVGCPQGLIREHDARERIEKWIDCGERVVVSLHWSWFRKFGHVTSGQMCRAFRDLGCAQVSEALWGLALYNQTLKEELEHKGKGHGLVLTSECVVAQSMIRKHYSQFTPMLVDPANPMTLHGRMIRQWCGTQSVKVVYVSPCAGYAAYACEDEAVMTFDGLISWMDDRAVEFSSAELTPEDAFFPSQCAWVPPLQTKDNLIRTYELDDAIRLLADVKGDDHVVLDLMACSGCVSNNSFEAKWVNVADYMAAKRHFHDKQYIDKRPMPTVDTAAHAPSQIEGEVEEVSDSQIIEALESLAKFKEYDHHNCNACGYGTCVNFARAMVRGMAPREMCLSYSRSQMYRKYTDLMERIPSGIMMVNRHGRVIQANRNMAAIMGRDAMLVYQASPGMKGADVDKLVGFSELIHRVMETGKDVTEVEVEQDDKLLRVSVFNVETGKCVCVVASNLLLGDVLDDQIVNETQRVIEENMQAVQQMAELLGQSAARTQKVLSMITLKRK